MAANTTPPNGNNVTNMSPAERSRRSARAAAARGEAAIREEIDVTEGQDFEAQIGRLQDDIKAIAATLAKLTERKAGEVREGAEAQVNSLVRQGQQAVGELSDQAYAMEASLKQSIREKPLTAVAAAAGIGFVLAMLSRR